MPHRSPPRYFLLALVSSLASLLFYSHSLAVQEETSSAGEYQDALKIAEKLRIALRNGRQQDASGLIQAATKLKPKDTLTTAAIYNALGNALADENYYQLAISHYEQALKILSGRPEREFEVLKQALQRLRSQGKSIRPSKGALSADLEFIEVKDVQSLKNSPSGLRKLSATLLINDGNVYLLQLQHPQAEELFRRALQAADVSTLTALRRRAYSNLAWSAIQQGRTQEAEEFLAIALKEHGSSSPIGLRRAMLAVAVGLRERQQYTEAIKKFEQILPLYNEANDLKGLTRATAHLAATHMAAGDPARAALLLEKIVDQPENMDSELARYVHATLAQANQRLGNLEIAIHHFEIYLDEIDKISSRLSTEEGVLSFRETQDEYFEDFIKTAWALATRQKTYAVGRAAIEKIRARSLFSLSQARRSWNIPPPGQMGARFLFYDGIARYRHEAAGGVAVIESRPRDKKVPSFSVLQIAPAVQISDQFGECVASSSDQSGESDVEHKTTEASSVTFLEYYVLKDQTITIVKDRDGKVFGASLPIGKSSLRDLVNKYVRLLDVSTRRGVKEVKVAGLAETGPANGSEEQLAQDLYKLLVQPVRRFLPSDPNTPVVIVPHHVLWYLPFAALAPQRGTRMIDDLQLTYAASEASWRLVVNRPRTITHRNARAWIVGNPALKGKVNLCGSSFEFADLPGARKEAQQIAELFGKDRAELFTGTQADRLRFEAWYSEFGVIHMAAHGIACANLPFDSSIMLAQVDASAVRIDESTDTLKIVVDDRFPINVCGLPKAEWERPAYFAGELTASAVISRYRLNADLVTLSACQTGLGATLGEGMIGFTRAFQAAGARTLVVTLWSVSDEATTDLMVEFYKEYLKHGNKAVALRNSMLATRKRYAEPRMWAAFSLFGAAE